jgi:hypothetical protein
MIIYATLKHLIITSYKLLRKIGGRKTILMDEGMFS